MSYLSLRLKDNKLLVCFNSENKPSPSNQYEIYHGFADKLLKWRSNYQFISFYSEEEKNKVIERYKFEMSYENFGHLKEKVLQKRFIEETNEINYIEIRSITSEEQTYLAKNTNYAFFKEPIREKSKRLYTREKW